jgi:ribosome-associated heat shock protein Hsp15
VADSLRIDKWLWTVRLYKTRSLATDACKAGKIKVDGQNIKPARELKVGEEIVVSQNPLLKKVKVLGFPPNRLSAKLVPEFMEDLTSPEEYERVKHLRETNMEFRPHGIGRPTKKHRRLIDKLKDEDNSEDW